MVAQRRLMKQIQDWLEEELEDTEEKEGINNEIRKRPTGRIWVTKKL